jgi:anaerobic magnesium-protoporphyrin IX monomethyl ester cyclase
MKVVVTTLNAKYIHTSLALRYLKAYCQQDFDMSISEYTIKDPVMHIVSDLYQREPDVLGFSCYIWNIEAIIPIIQIMKKIKPQLKIVLGGPEVSYDVGYWLKRIPEVDFIVMGEGEATFHQLLHEISATENYPDVQGIAYRHDSKVKMNQTRPKLELAQIPSPYQFEEDRLGLANRVTYVETSRGCPFSCQFCLSSIEVGVRYFPIDHMKAQLLYLIHSGAKLIKFVDRTFNIKREYALDIFEFLIQNHQGCVFQFEITADIMRPEVLDYLAEHAPAGIFRFEIGVQSTNEHTNEIVQRKQNFMKLSRTVHLIKQSGKIDQHLDLIAGLPEENYESFRQTFNDVFALRPEELQLGFLKMLRGTGLRHDADKYGYVYMDQAPYEILANDVLPFQDVIRIKRVEDVLEKYWNAHRMDHTLHYLIAHEFATPFDFFQQFGDFWDKQGWSKIGHQLEDLYTRLYAFLVDRDSRHLAVSLGFMKLDYFLAHKYKPRKIWWDTSKIDKQEQAHVVNLLREQPGRVSDSFAQLQLKEKEVHSNIMIERVPFDVHVYLSTGEVQASDCVLLAYYAPEHKEGAQIFGLPVVQQTLS